VTGHVEHSSVAHSQKRPVAPARPKVTGSNRGKASGPGFGLSVQLIPNTPPRSGNGASAATPSVDPVVHTFCIFLASSLQPADT
jgi:hypothetical protein